MTVIHISALQRLGLNWDQSQRHDTVPDRCVQTRTHALVQQHPSIIHHPPVRPRTSNNNSGFIIAPILSASTKSIKESRLFQLIFDSPPHLNWAVFLVWTIQIKSNLLNQRSTRTESGCIGNLLSEAEYLTENRADSEGQ